MLSTPAFALMLAPAVLLAGCAASSYGNDHAAAAALDTGILQPGDSGTLVFEKPGISAIHCDPHPFMEQEVVVEAGAPGSEHVHILDGASTAAFRFDPPTIRVALGAVVTYHDHGYVAHTASEMTTDMQH